MMSDAKGTTPETDAHIAGGEGYVGGRLVHADFARTLERQRDALAERVNEAEGHAESRLVTLAGAARRPWNLIDRALKMMQFAGYAIAPVNAEHNNPIIAWMADARAYLAEQGDAAAASVTDAGRE